MSFLKDLKARRSVPRTRAATHINSEPSPASEFLRYLRDGDVIRDTVEGRVVQPSETIYQEASRRARVLDVMIKVATDRHGLDSQSMLKRAEGVMVENKALLKLLEQIYPRQLEPLDSMFDFGPDERFRDRFPPIMENVV